MSEIEQQLRDSLGIVGRLHMSTRALAEVTAELRRVMDECERLKIELRIAHLKLERKHLRLVPGTPVRPQA